MSIDMGLFVRNLCIRRPMRGVSARVKAIRASRNYERSAKPPPVPETARGFSFLSIAESFCCWAADPARCAGRPDKEPSSRPHLTFVFVILWGHLFKGRLPGLQPENLGSRHRVSPPIRGACSRLRFRPYPCPRCGFDPPPPPSPITLRVYLGRLSGGVPS